MVSVSLPSIPNQIMTPDCYVHRNLNAYKMGKGRAEFVFVTEENHTFLELRRLFVF